MKSVRLHPLDTTVHVLTGARLLDGLLAKALKVKMACKGRGACATCHVFVRSGKDKLSEPTPREAKTLALIAHTEADSRLACQCQVLGEGIVVEVPEVMYVQTYEDVKDLVGESAAKDFLHPITGEVLIPKNKIITRTMLKVCFTAADDLRKLQEG